MENKYYTPEIEEFYIGFEFESKETFTDGTVKTQEDYDRCNWVKNICEVGDAPYIERALIGKNAQNGLCGVRVKHLDREDIESLGWEQIEYDSFKIGSFIFELNNEYKSFIYSGKDKGNVFVGNIKNKSELKKLMQMLNIE